MSGIEYNLRQSRKRAVPDEVMLFIFLHTLRDGNEGSVGMELMSRIYGLSCGTILNYIRHVGCTLMSVMKSNDDEAIRWRNISGRQAMQGLVYGFSKCIAFVDSTKQQVFRPLDAQIQESRYECHYRFHSFSLLLWTDVYRVIMLLDMIIVGSMHDSGTNNDSAPYRDPASYFSGGEFAIGDTGFQGAGEHIVCPSKKYQATGFSLRSTMNRYIRQQRIRNEWAVGLISNRFRLFLGRWPLEDNYFHILYEVAALLVNWRIRRTGIGPVPLQRMMDRLEIYEKDI